MLTNPRCEQVLEAILESAEDAILGIALDGSIELWSRGAERMYGYTSDEVRGQSLVALLPIYEVPAMEAVLAAARNQKIAESETVDRLHKLGSKLSVAVRRTIIRDEQGMVTGILETGRPVHQKVEDTASETQLRLLVEQMPVLLWTTDQHLRITSNWGSGLQHSEIHAGNLVGRSVSEYLKCPDTNTMNSPPLFGAEGRIRTLRVQAPGSGVGNSFGATALSVLGNYRVHWSWS